MLAIDFLANIRIQIYRILRYVQRDIRPFLYQVSNRILWIYIKSGLSGRISD